MENNSFSITSDKKKKDVVFSVDKLEIELLNKKKNIKIPSLTILTHSDSDIQPIDQDKTLSLTNLKNKTGQSKQSLSIKYSNQNINENDNKDQKYNTKNNNIINDTEINDNIKKNNNNIRSEYKCNNEKINNNKLNDKKGLKAYNKKIINKNSDKNIAKKNSKKNIIIKDNKNDQMYEISSESDIIEKINLEDDLKTTLINKKINIYDNDNDIDHQDYKESGTDNNRFNVSSDRLIGNQPKIINIDLSDKIQEMFSYNNVNNNSTQINNNLEQKPKTKKKKEIIYSYESKKLKKDKNKETEDTKGKENKTVENNEDSRNVTQMGQINNIKPKNTNRYLPINSNSNRNEKRNKLPLIKKKSKKNKKFVNINIDIKEIKSKNKSISQNKNDNIEQNLKGNKEIKQRESIIDSNDPHYLLYSNIALGVPQNVKDSYKLLKNKPKFTKKKKDVKSPDHDRKIEYLRTFDVENE